MSDQEAKRIGRCSDYSVRIYPAPDPVTPPEEPSSDYKYGWPGDITNTEESGVVAQWLFEESGSNVVDVVNNITLTPSSSTVMAYGVSTLDYSNNMTKGIYLPAPSQKFTNGNVEVPEMVAGTNDIVIEMIIKIMNVVNLGGGTSPHFFSTVGGAGKTGIIMLYSSLAANATMTTTIVTTDGTTYSINFFDLHSGQSPFSTFGWYKYRMVIDRSANSGNGTITMYVNGVSLASSNLTLGTKEIGCSGVNIGGRSDNFRNSNMILKEFRYSIGNKTNNSGGPNGG